MGTRSTTTVYDESGTPLVCLYRQYDGYPEGHGVELNAFLAGKKLVNGIPVGKPGFNPEMHFNGMGCLAASIVAHFKKKIGDFYIYPPGNVQQYNYHVKCDDLGNIVVTVTEE